MNKRIHFVNLSNPKLDLHVLEPTCKQGIGVRPDGVVGGYGTPYASLYAHSHPLLTQAAVDGVRK